MEKKHIIGIIGALALVASLLAIKAYNEGSLAVPGAAAQSVAPQAAPADPYSGYSAPAPQQ